MPIATTDEQRAAADALRSWGASADPIALTRAQEQEPGRWRERWRDLSDFGLFAVALPAERGGLGGSVTDLAALLEEAAALLVPGPVLPSALAGLVLARTDAQHAGDGISSGWRWAVGVPPPMRA
jgi:alkylation response protein AidB-like acyl-CoA dehydrogenase